MVLNPETHARGFVIENEPGYLYSSHLFIESIDAQAMMEEYIREDADLARSYDLGDTRVVEVLARKQDGKIQWIRNEEKEKEGWESAWDQAHYEEKITSFDEKVYWKKQW